LLLDAQVGLHVHTSSELQADPVEGRYWTLNAACAGIHVTGSGVQVAMGGRVTVDGLQSNEAYNFAVAGQ